MPQRRNVSTFVTANEKPGHRDGYAQFNRCLLRLLQKVLVTFAKCFCQISVHPSSESSILPQTLISDMFSIILQKSTEENRVMDCYSWSYLSLLSETLNCHNTSGESRAVICNRCCNTTGIAWFVQITLMKSQCGFVG